VESRITNHTLDAYDRCLSTRLMWYVVMIFNVEQSERNQMMECGTARCVLIRTLRRHSNVLCAMSAREHPPGKYLLLILYSVLFVIMPLACVAQCKQGCFIRLSNVSIDCRSTFNHSFSVLPNICTNLVFVQTQITLLSYSAKCAYNTNSWVVIQSY